MEGDIFDAICCMACFLYSRTRSLAYSHCIYLPAYRKCACAPETSKYWTRGSCSHRLNGLPYTFSLSFKQRLPAYSVRSWAPEG